MKKVIVIILFILPLIVIQSLRSEEKEEKDEKKEEPCGIIIALEGDDNEIILGSGGRKRIHLREEIFAGNEIISPTRGRLRIVFIDGSIVSLGPGSHLKVIMYQVDEEKVLRFSILELRRGILKAAVPEGIWIHKKSKFEVQTRNASIWAPGVVFFVSYRPKTDVSEVIVINGDVNVQNMYIAIKNEKEGGYSIENMVIVHDLEMSFVEAENPPRTPMVVEYYYLEEVIQNTMVSLPLRIDDPSIDPGPAVYFEERVLLNKRAIEEFKRLKETDVYVPPFKDDPERGGPLKEEGKPSLYEFLYDLPLQY